MPPSKDGEGFSSTSTSSAGPVYNDLGWMTTNARGYTIKEEPYGTKRKLRVIHIGAGASGITFAKFLEDRLENVELQIYEKNADVGGTWLENRCVVRQLCLKHSILFDPFFKMMPVQGLSD